MTDVSDDSLMDRVRRADPDRFLCALFAPARHRATLLLLCAFNDELARAREVASQPMLALIRLQWWREVVNGTRRRHDVAGPLGDAIDSGRLDPRDLSLMIDAREIECDDSVADLETWRRYVMGIGGALAAASGRLLGADAGEMDRLRDLGAAYAVAGQLGSVAALAARQRCQLPADLLAAHGLTPEHVLLDPACAEAIRPELRQMGLALWQKGRGAFPRAVMAAALPAVLAQRDLARGARHRGLGDKLCVLRAAVRARI